jgi:hypothetical protein
VQSLQATLRSNSDRWLAQGQRASDRFAAWLTEIIQTAEFWTIVLLLVVGGTVYRYRRTVKTQLQIWRIRRGRGAANEDIVEQLFYRATRVAERTMPKRQPAETWREWTFGLPDPHRRSILRRALEVFERSKYGRMPVSGADFALLEETIRELKL